jgi:hypothetical protein
MGILKVGSLKSQNSFRVFSIKHITYSYLYWKIHICRVRGKPTFKIRPEPYRLLARHPRVDARGAPGADIGSGDFELTFVILCVSMVCLSSLKHKEILIMLPQQSPHF